MKRADANEARLIDASSLHHEHELRHKHELRRGGAIGLNKHVFCIYDEHYRTMTTVILSFSMCTSSWDLKFSFKSHKSDGFCGERRSIRSGPEATSSAARRSTTQKHKGIYWICYYEKIQVVRNINVMRCVGDAVWKYNNKLLGHWNEILCLQCSCENLNVCFTRGYSPPGETQFDRKPYRFATQL